LSYFGSSLKVAIVEQLNQGLCVEEAGQLSSIMTLTMSQNKAVAGGSSKSQGTSKTSKQVTIAAKTEVMANPYMRCWNCRLLGHGKKDCSTNTPFEGKNGGQSTIKKGDTTMTNKGQQKKTQGRGTLPKCTYAPYSEIGHTEDKCWVKNP